MAFEIGINHKNRLAPAGFAPQTPVCGASNYTGFSPRHLNKSFFEQTNLNFGAKPLLPTFPFSNIQVACL